MMTDTEMARRKAICEAANVDDIGEVSDGFHTFNSLYEQRMILFAALVKAYKTKAWKSYRHENGEYCFDGGWFVVGIDTPEGNYTYHYENKYWDMFDCIDLPRAPHWDGHTEADAETRLMSLEPEIKTDGDIISRQDAINLAYDCEDEFGKDVAFRFAYYLRQLPSAQPETYKEKLKEIADALSEKFAYMNTCLNERDIILGYLGVKRPSETHCNTDCTNIKCESYCYNKRLSSAQPEINTDEDTISRQAAIDAVSDACFELRGVFGRCEDAIKALPSTQFERKIGQWIFEERKRLVDETDDGAVYRTEKWWSCSECGYTKGYHISKPSSNYCENCGAEMLKEGKE